MTQTNTESGDDKRSVARSVSSESTAAAAITVARFNQFDEMLFTLMYTFFKERRLGPAFQLLEVILTVIQCIAVTFQRNDWPMSGKFYQIFEDVFRWLTFSISWNSNSFLISLTIIYGILAFIVIVGVVICILINNQGTIQINIIGKVLNIIVSLLTGIFYLPAINIFFGSFHCIGKAGTSSFTTGINCAGSIDLILLILGMILFVLYFCFTFLVRLFVIQTDFRKGGSFALQTGLYPVLVQVFTTFIPIVGIILRSQQAAIAGIGIAISFLLTIYPIGLQPYFSPLGNTIWASAMSIMGITFIVGLLCSFLDTTQTWVYVFIWFLFVILVIGIPLIIGFLTYKRAQSLWAMREDEEVPEIKSKKNPLIILSNTQQQQAYPTQSQTSQIIQPVNKSPRVIQNRSVNANEPIPNTNASQSISIPQSNRFTPEIQPSLYQPAINDQLHFFAQDQQSSNNIQNVFKPMKKTVPLPKYKSVFAYQNAIKFLNVSKLRKKQECIVLAEQLLSAGQRKFGSESSMWAIISLYHLYFSKNTLRLTDSLTNLKQNMPNIVERWLVYVMMHDLENKQSQGSGSNQLGVTFRIRFAKATKEHDFSKAYLSQAYMYLTRENMDLEGIMSLLDKAILHERLSREIFEELMKLHPNSTTLLRGFGALLRDIYRDDETALLMFNQATSIEEDQAMTIKEGGDGQSQMQKSIHSSYHPGSIASKKSDGKSFATSKKKKKKSSNKSSLTIDLSQNKQNLIPGFLQLILLCMTIITVCLLVSFIFVITSFSSCKKTVISLIVQNYDVFIFCKYFGLREDESDGKIDLSEVSFVPTMEKIKNITQQTTLLLSSTLKDAYLQTSDENIFRHWEQEYINQTLANYIFDESGASQISYMWEVQGNILDMISSISNIADDLSSENWDSNQVRYKNLLLYMRANIPITITEVLKMIGIEYCESAQKQAIISVVIAVVLGFIALTVPLAVNITQFVNTIMKLKSERHKVFFHLAKSQKSEFFNLKKRLDDVEKDDEAETLSLISTTEQSQYDNDDDIDALEKKNKKKDNDEENFDLLEDDNDQDEQELKQKREEDENELNNNQMSQNNGMMNFGSGINMNGEQSAIQQQLQLQMMQFQLMQQQQMLGKAGVHGMMNSMAILQPGMDGIIVGQQITDLDNKGDLKKAQNDKQKNNSEEQGEINKQLHDEQELMQKIKKISSFIPTRFYAFLLVGFVLILIFPLIFMIIAIYASLTVVEYNTAVFLTGYRTSLLMTCVLLSINLATTSSMAIKWNFECTLSTNPMWNDLSSMTDNKTLLQELMSKALTFLQQINVRLMYGTSSKEAQDTTGDSRIDGITSIRTLKKNSETQTIQYDEHECFESRSGDCDIPHRIYGLTKSFRGLEALIGIFTQACAELITKENPNTEISTKTSSVQQMGSLMIYDLKGGCSQYRLAMIDEQSKTTQMLQTLLILFFILAISFTIIGFILIIGTRNILFTVAESSTKITELDPETDASERTGMGASAWKEQYSCDCLRIDKQHQRVLLYLACLCGSLDPQMNVNEQIDTLMNSEEGMNSVDTQTILQHYSSIRIERAQQNQGVVGGQINQGDGADNENIHKNLDATGNMSKTQLKELVKKQLSIAAILFRTTFATFTDEEHLIFKYKIPHSHKKAHYTYHATIIRKIQTQMLSIASSSRNKDGPTLIPSTHAQSLIRLYSSWLTDHVAKMDRELATLLVGKAPESELERDVPVPSELKVPHSYTQFLDSDNASLQDKTLFNKLVRVLKLKQHSLL